MKIIAKPLLTEARIRANLTIHELASKANVPVGTLSRAENGHSISMRSAHKLCNFYKQQFESLFEITGREN
ncbi:MAG: helix-turn-helix transcriptional regulator [Lachnospiraceae bacterium]|nr:helix-turn-helix transcriptional regulator [Lachnospiraceae bacterium]